jgi:hypothetical protein
MKEANEVTAGKLASVYIKIRSKRAELLAAYELEDNKLKEALETLEEEMLEKCKDEDADSIKTPFGTIVRSVKTRYWPADWEIFNQFVIDNEALGLLEKRVHQTNMGQWLEEHTDNPPPGLNIDRRYACTVRKAAK